MDLEQETAQRADKKEKERTPRDEAQKSEPRPPEDRPVPSDAKEPSPRKDPIRWITRAVLIFVLVVFVWYLFADRLTPYTDQGRVQALLTPIVPQVSGYLTEVNVRLHSMVDTRFFSRSILVPTRSR